MNDYELGRKLGVAPTTVCYHRKLAGIKPCRLWAKTNPTVCEATKLREKIKTLALADPDNLNYAEIGRAVGVSREWVRRVIENLIAEARAKVRARKRSNAA